MKAIRTLTIWIVDDSPHPKWTEAKDFARRLGEIRGTTVEIRSTRVPTANSVHVSNRRPRDRFCAKRRKLRLGREVG